MIPEILGFHILLTRLKQMLYILIMFITLFKIIELLLWMNLLEELCQIDVGGMVYIKRSKQRKSYKFVKKQKLLQLLHIKTFSYFIQNCLG